MRHVWAGIALISFILSLLVHFGTYVDFNAWEIFPVTRTLAILVVFLPFTIPRTQITNAKALIPHIPNWQKIFVILTFIYVMVNFVIYLADIRLNGMPERISGNYSVYIDEDGQEIFMRPNENTINLEIVSLQEQAALQKMVEGHRVYHEISEEEYYQLSLKTTRGITGHLIFFSLLCVLALWHKAPESKN